MTVLTWFCGLPGPSWRLRTCTCRKSMSLATGGFAIGATSTRSRSASAANRRAISTRTMPTCSPFGPTNRTSGTRMRSLMRGSLMLFSFVVVIATRERPRADARGALDRWHGNASRRHRSDVGRTAGPEPGDGSVDAGGSGLLLHAVDLRPRPVQRSRLPAPAAYLRNPGSASRRRLPRTQILLRGVPTSASRRRCGQRRRKASPSIRARNSPSVAKRSPGESPAPAPGRG